MREPYTPAYLYGKPVQRATKHAQVEIDGTTYIAALDLRRGDYAVEARRPVQVKGQDKVMRIKEIVSEDAVSAAMDQTFYDPVTTALMLGHQKLEPLVAYRLRELNGEDQLAHDPLIDGALEVQRLANEAAEQEELEQVAGWGAWG